MANQTFRKQIVLSSILTAIAVVAIIVFCVVMFKKYSIPNENNTSVMSATVTDVYFTSPKHTAEIAISGGEPLELVSPNGLRNLYSTIGYDIEQLAQLLEGKTIEYRRMNDMPWIVEINVGDTKIDNNKLTIQEMVVTRVAIVILGLLMLVISISCYVVYLKAKYKRYLKAKKKQERKEKRELKLMAKKSR